jgi:pyruvate/2-oxoglutarate dehydrogenase complex dihydrolipoamide acyltransferase (E2) component
MSEIKNIVLPEEVGKNAESSIVMWYKEVGDDFEKGENLVEVQTEKVALDIPAPFSGILKEIKVNRGEAATVGDVIAIATTK